MMLIENRGLIHNIKYHFNIKNIIPKVSVIVPNLNNARYLHECLDSIVNQELKEIEIIIVDSGSNDGSIQIIKEYQRNDNRIKLIRVNYKSYGYQMNVGITKAKGEYIGIVESDDFISLNMYSELYKIATEYECQMVKADFTRFTTNADGSRKLVNNKICGDTKIYYNKIINTSEDLKTFDFIMNTWSGIYSRKFIYKYNIRHNESSGASFQDNGFWFQTFMYCERAYFIDKPFYMNRRDNIASSIYSKNDIFAFNNEYDYIEKIISSKNQNKRFLDLAIIKRFKNYIFNIKRLRLEDKFLFLRRMKKELSDYKIKEKNIQFALNFIKKYKISHIN